MILHINILELEKCFFLGKGQVSQILTVNVDRFGNGGVANEINKCWWGQKQWALTIVKKRKPTLWNFSNIFEMGKHFG